MKKVNKHKKEQYLEGLLQGSSQDKKIEVAKLQFLEELSYFLAKILLIILIVYSYGKITGYIFYFTQYFELQGQIRIDDIQYYIISGFAIIPLFNLLKTFPHLFYSLSIEVYASKDYIIYKEGFSHKKIEKIFIKNIDNIDFTVSPVGKIFNYGALHLANAGGKVSLLCVKNTKENFDKLKVLIDIPKSI